MKILSLVNIRFIPLISLSLLLNACGGEEQNFNDTMMDPMVSEDEPAAVDDSQLEEIIHAIPSPIEMTMLIKSSDAQYNPEALNATDNYAKYTTSHDRALNLGVYGADLGYLNLYGKTGTSLEYLKAIKNLADELSVGQFFDFKQLQQLSESEDNMDSLITISTRNFSEMNRYLREQRRGKISVLVVTGTFIEGLHIACQIVEKDGIEPIKERIGEQKLTIQDVIAILEVYKSDEVFAKLITEFEALNAAMDDVTIEVTEGEGEMKEIDGVLTFVGGDESKVIISDETLQHIIRTVKKVRNNIVK